MVSASPGPDDVTTTITSVASAVIPQVTTNLLWSLGRARPLPRLQRRFVVTWGMTALATLVIVVVTSSGPGLAETMALKLLPNYSRATFKSDALLETFVGNTAAEGVAGDRKSVV